MRQNTSGRGFYGQLFRMVLPMAAQNLMIALVNAADVIMLGLLKPNGSTLLASVSLATRVSFFQHFMIFGVTAGIAAMAAQYWGKGDKDSVERIQHIALRYTMPFSILTFVVALFFPDALMRLFTDDPDMLRFGVDYLRIASFSYLFLGASQVMLTVMKNSGRVLRSSVYASTTVVLNIVLNGVLIFNLLGWDAVSGIKGAALATTLARGVELILCLLENVRQKEILLKPRLLIERMPRLEKAFWHYTRPLIANCAAWGGGMTVYSMVIGHFSQEVVAAHSVANIVKDCCDCVGGGVGAGGGILLGNELGRNEFDKARKDGRRLVILSLIVGTAAGLVLLALSPLVVAASGFLIQGVNDTTRHYLRSMLYMCSYYMIGRTLNTMLINGIFSAGGDTSFGFWCDLINLWSVIIPAAWIVAALTHFQNPLLVYFILYLDEFTKIPVEYLHYKKYRWVRNITTEQQR